MNTPDMPGHRSGGPAWMG